MIREIKFRIICQNEILGYERLIESGWEWMALDLNPKDKEIWHKGTFADSDSYKLIRSQFTGLKDKNGVEIFEGDILCWESYENKEHNIRWVVEFNIDRGFKSWSSTRNDEKIIGNVFHNSDLLNY